MPAIEELISIVLSAGAAARGCRDSLSVEYKNDLDASPVTSADLASDAVFAAELPQYGFDIISEESGIKNAESEYAFLIDPLDGTRAFINKEPGWSVMLGVIRNGVPVAGIVYAPGDDIVWYTDGAKAYKREKGVTREILVSPTGDPRMTSMLTSVSHHTKEMAHISKRLGAQEIPLHGAGTKLCVIADGAAGFYWSRSGLSEWDLCAGHAILVAAGGVVTDADGADILYGKSLPMKGVAASTTLLHPLLVDAALA